MSATPMSRTLTFISVSLSAILLCAVPPGAGAAPTLRYSGTVRGNLSTTGNTLGLAGGAGGPSVNDGIGAFIDGTGTLQVPGWPLGTTLDWTLASSTGVLDLPAGATILHAELVWGGSVSAGVIGSLDAPVELRGPSGLLHEVTPDAATAAPADGTMRDAGYYGRSATVTSLIEGAGTYRVGRVPSSLGNGDGAVGWSLYVVYGLASETPKRLAVASIMEQVDAAPNGDMTVELSGLCIPNASGSRLARVAVTSMEGDATITGETLRFARLTNQLGDGGARIAPPGNTLTNPLTSRITGNDGAIDTRGSFGNVNHTSSANVSGARQGWDLTNIDATTSLATNWESAFFRPNSGDDLHSLLALGLVVRHRTPILSDGGAVVVVAPTLATIGTVLSVTVTLANTGDAGASSGVFTMSLPAGISYVPSSFLFNGAFPVGGAVTASNALTTGVSLPTIGEGATATVTLSMRVDAVPTGGLSLAPRVVYQNQACAGVAVPEIFDPSPVSPVIFTECGNGRIEAGEVCDDGDATGLDGCSATCLQEPGYSCGPNPGGNGTPSRPDSFCVSTCGDGVIAVGRERCDDGNNVGLDGCTVGCFVEYGYACPGPAGTAAHCITACGDGQVAVGTETCDGGSAGVLDSNDGCDATCQVVDGWTCATRAPGAGTSVNPDSTCSTECGDGVVAAGAEACDDDNLAPLDGCSPVCESERGWTCGATCVAIACGDGIRALGAEACDDGNASSGDGCSDACLVEVGFGCEHTAVDGDAEPDSVCVTTCGDDVRAGSELCDDGNLALLDGCSSTCEFERGWTCGATCAPIACGDGIRALGGEDCDDGNVSSGDGCSDACLVEVGYACEHTAVDGDAAPDSVCATTCGDAVRAASEFCDDGNLATGDGCGADCLEEPGWSCGGAVGAASTCFVICGDGLIRGDEVCDDDNVEPAPLSGEDPDGCFANCSEIDFGWGCEGEPSVCVTTCGDGRIGRNVEVCDDGNVVAGDGCVGDCAEVERGWSCGDPPLSPSTCEPLCGDGLVRGVEGCDDGDNDDGDGCSADCRVEDNWICVEADPESPSICFEDGDEDGVFDDGDQSGDPTDNPCEAGETVGCDDNCPAFANPDQTFPDRPHPLCPPYEGPRTQGGGGCGGGPVGLWGLLALGFVVIGRSLRRWSVGVGFVAMMMVGGMAGGDARAQDVDPRAYDASLSPLGVLSVDTTGINGHLRPFVSLLGSFANDEVITRVASDFTERGPLKERFILTLAAGLGLFDRLEVAVGVPLVSTSMGPGGLDVGVEDGAGESAAGLGDVRLVVRGRLLGPHVDEAGFGLGLSAEVTVPTGGDAFMTDGGATFLPRLIVDYRDGAGFAVAVNAGYRMRPAVAVDDLVIDDELRLGLGAEVPVGAFGLAFVAEANAGFGLGDSAYDEGGIASREVQAEGLGGLRWRSTGGWVVSAAAGSGMSQGYGAADFRVVFGVTWNAAVASPIDEPMVAAVKNANRDPWRDEVKVPVVPPARGAPVPSEVFDAIVLADPDTDVDGIMIPADQCPDEPEDRDGFQDEDGCPDPDNDADGILDAADKCPDAKEVFNGSDDDDGCPDEGAAILTKDGDMLKIPDRIRFKSGSAELLPSDKLILDPVAAVLKSGGFGRLRIEGHTDNLGDREFNVDLAERRAWSVRSYLIEQGVDGERLFAKGFGPTRPVGSNATEPGRAQNRRVEFHMVKPGEPVEGIIR